MSLGFRLRIPCLTPYLSGNFRRTTWSTAPFSSVTRRSCSFSGSAASISAANSANVCFAIRPPYSGTGMPPAYSPLKRTGRAIGPMIAAFAHVLQRERVSRDGQIANRQPGGPFRLRQHPLGWRRKAALGRLRPQVDQSLLEGQRVITRDRILHSDVLHHGGLTENLGRVIARRRKRFGDEVPCAEQHQHYFGFIERATSRQREKRSAVGVDGFSPPENHLSTVASRHPPSIF